MTFINEKILSIAARVESAKAGREEGAAMAEYGLLIALIAVVAAVGATALGTNIASRFTAVASTIGG